MAVVEGQIEVHPERPDHPAVAALLDELDRYLASLYPPEANHVLDLAALCAPEIRFLAAWRGETLVGCGATLLRPAEPATAGRAYGEVKRMVVAPAARGQGAGRALLAALEAGLRADRIGLARLETGRDQQAAVRLYEAAGYCPCAPFAGYPDNGLSLFFSKSLDVAA
ncbi:MAG: GNAT family N-acetyltransferase [Rubrivivax sp.]